MSLSWDVVFPFIAVYLMASLARDGMLVARVLFRAAAGCMPAPAGCVPAAAVAAAPCKASTMSTPNQASTTAKHLNVPNEIYMLPGNLANKKVHLFKQCGGRPSEMVTFDVCKHCQRKSEKTD